MKRFFTLCLSLIFILCLCVPAYAEQVFLLDPWSGEIITSSDGKGNNNTANYASVTSSCRFDRTRNLFILNFSGDSKQDICCTMYKGMVTTDPVAIQTGSLANISVFRDGAEVPAEEYSSMSETGSYIIRDNTTGTEVSKFTIIPKLTGALTVYPVPSIFYITSATVNGESIALSGNDVPMTEEGRYVISYCNDNMGKTYTLTVDVDHTDPQLTVTGVVDGIAKSAVSFTNFEDGAKILVKKDGEPINYREGEELKNPGDYVVYYSDKAGNTVSMAFTIMIFFDSAAWIYVGIIGALLVAGLVYMIMSRKNLRTC